MIYKTAIRRFVVLLLAMGALVSSVQGQTLRYALPLKKLRVTVVYTVMSTVTREKLSGGGDPVVHQEHRVIIEDDVIIESVITPDPARTFSVAWPGGRRKGAGVDWSLALDKNGSGLLAAVNGSREPATSGYLSAAVGWAAQLITTASGSSIARAPATAKLYEETSKQKIATTEIIDVPANGLTDHRIASPSLSVDVPFPGVSISVQRESPATEQQEQAAAGPSVDDRLYYVIPARFRLSVYLHDNGHLKKGKILEEYLLFPQHGLLRSIETAMLKKGKSSLAFAVNTETGQLLNFQRTAGGSTRNDLDAVNRKLAELGSAVADWSQERKYGDLSDEIKRLELETDRLKLLNLRDQLAQD